MIYCPKCGTANRDLSRFCNECGHELVRATAIKCPECGHHNPVHAILCQECGQRLEAALPSPEPTPDTPSIKALSLPVKGREDEEDAPQGGEEPSLADDAPAWLQGLSAAFPSGIGPADAGEDEMPAWLAELGVDLPAVDDAGTPSGAEAPEAVDAGETPDPISTGEPEPSDAALPRSEAAPSEEAPIWPDDWGAEPEVPSEPTLDGEDVPTWLQQLLDQDAESGSGAGEAETASAPPADADWLEEPVPIEAAPSDAARLADAEAELELADEAVPSWLAELQREAGAARKPREAEAEPPAWQDEPQPEEQPMALDAEPEPPEQEPAEEAEAEAVVAHPIPPAAPSTVLDTEAELTEAALLGWVDELEAQGPPMDSPIAAEVEPEFTEDESPDWVRDLRRGEMAPTPSAALPVASEAEPGLPAEPEAGGRAEGPPERLPPQEPGQPPSWLTEDEDDLDLEDHWLMQAMPEPLDRVPDWMAALRPDVPRVEVEAASEESMPDWLLTWTEDLLTEGQDELVRAEIPEWLWALRPQAALDALEARPALGEDKVETRGILAGRKGVLPVEPIMALPPSTGRRPPTSPPPDRSRAAVFQEVVTQPPVLRPQVVSRPVADMVPPVGRWVIYLLLLAAVIVPLVLQTGLFARPPAPPGPVRALHDTVATLEPNAPVLVVFDYTPTTSGEMDLLAETLVAHLADRGARVVALSLSPSGPQLAQDVLDRVMADKPGYTYCQQYVNLGYVTGQVAAPRALAQTLWEGIAYDHRRACTGPSGQLVPASDLPATAGVRTLGDFALIVDLAAQQSSVRWWIEQVGVQVEGVRLAAAVSAAVEPFIRPYAESSPPQLVGYMAGWPQTSDYLALRGHPGWALGGRLDAQILGHGAIILLIVAGNVAYVVQLARRRE